MQLSNSENIEEKNARLLAETKDLKSHIEMLEDEKEYLIAVVFSIQVLIYSDQSEPTTEFTLM